MDRTIDNTNHLDKDKLGNDTEPSFHVDLQLLSQRITPTFEAAVVRQFEQVLGLSYMPIKEVGNVCFAHNNDELRDDFKITFTSIDLLDYIYAVRYSNTYREVHTALNEGDSLLVPYPTDATSFWQLVEFGGTIRNSIPDV